MGGGAAARRSRRCPTRRSTTATRAATTELRTELAAYLVRVRGAAASPDDLIVTVRLHAGAVADVPGARSGAARRAWPSRTRRSTTRGRRSAPPGSRSSACPSTSTGSTRRARRRRGARHARAPVPDRRGALARSAGARCSPGAGSCSRTTTTPSTATTARRSARCSGSRRTASSTSGTASKTLAPALRLGWVLAPPELTRRDRAGALGGRLRRPGDQRPRLRAADRDRRGRPAPAPHPPRVPRAPRRAGRGAGATLPGCAVDGVAAGLHLLLRLPPGTDEAGGGGARSPEQPHPRQRPQHLPPRAARRARAGDRATAACSGPRSPERSRPWRDALVARRRQEVAADLLDDQLPCGRSVRVGPASDQATTPSSRHWSPSLVLRPRRR